MFKLQLVSFIYRIGEKSGQLSRIPGGSGELSHDEFATFLDLVFSFDAQDVTTEDFAELTFCTPDGKEWKYQLSDGEEVFTQDQISDRLYTDLSHLVALEWGASSVTQFKNLLLREPRVPSETASRYLSDILTLEREIDEITGKLDGAKPEMQQIRRLQRKIAQVNAVRRLLWAKVCRLQEQTEKFSSAMQGVIGTPVKPEYVAAVQDEKAKIDELSTQISSLTDKMSELESWAARYRRSLTLLSGSGLVACAIIGGLFLDFVQGGLLIGMILIGLIMFGSGFLVFWQTKPKADSYFLSQDQLLDSKTALRRAKKEYKKILAGADETELWDRVSAQKEAQEIRIQLDYQLDRYTKAWQGTNAKLSQDQLVQAYTRISGLVGSTGGQEQAAKLADLLTRRQRLVVEIEAATFREPFWVAEKAAGKSQDIDQQELIASMLVPEETPAFWIGAPPLNTENQGEKHQLIIVR